MSCPFVTGGVPEHDLGPPPNFLGDIGHPGIGGHQQAGLLSQHLDGPAAFARQFVLVPPDFHPGLGVPPAFRQGIVTFPNARDLREVAKSVPLDRLLVETDCPYLAPVPLRGKRNEPAYVLEVARTIADVKGIGVEEVDAAVTGNFAHLFAGEKRAPTRAATR